MREPRKPTQTELHQLARHIHGERCYGGNFEEARIAAEAAYVSVFDSYMTECPGYEGKLMVVVWSAEPSFYQVYIWTDGDIASLDQSQEVRVGNQLYEDCS